MSEQQYAIHDPLRARTKAQLVEELEHRQRVLESLAKRFDTVVAERNRLDDSLVQTLITIDNCRDECARAIEQRDHARRLAELFSEAGQRFLGGEPTGRQLTEVVELGSGPYDDWYPGRAQPERER